MSVLSEHLKPVAFTNEAVDAILCHPCPICRAVQGQRCFEWGSNKHIVEWHKAFHWARKDMAVKKITARLKGEA